MKDIEKLEIILADDDFDDRTFFREVIQDLKPGTVLKECVDGKQVMDVLNQIQDPPHLIFLDINMPFKTGMQCLKEIRANEKFAGVPIIIFTTSTNQFEIDNSFVCGANLYIRKPYSYKEGRETLRKFFTDFDTETLMHIPKDHYYVEL